MGIRMAELAIQTLEARRNQLTAKSTICAAAASGIIVGTLQFLAPAIPRHPLLVTPFAAGGVICGMMALIESLNVIKRLGRKARAARWETAHLLHFRTIAGLPAETINARLAAMNQVSYIRELAWQAKSLARNAEGRYAALGRSYKWLAIGAVCFAIGALAVTVASIIDIGHELPQNRNMLPAPCPSPPIVTCIPPSCVDPLDLFSYEGQER